MDSDSVNRRYLYRLENLGIIRLKQEKDSKRGWYDYSWDLTDKGKRLIEKYDNLESLYKDGKVEEFLKEIDKISRIYKIYSISDEFS